MGCHVVPTSQGSIINAAWDALEFQPLANGHTLVPNYIPLLRPCGALLNKTIQRFAKIA